METSLSEDESQFKISRYKTPRGEQVPTIFQPLFIPNLDSCLCPLQPYVVPSFFFSPFFFIVILVWNRKKGKIVEQDLF